MLSIDYDSSKTALYTPALRQTVFEAGKSYSKLQLGSECARLAYLKAEASTHEKGILEEALSRVGFADVRLFGDATTGTQGFGCLRQSDKQAIIAFRGTQPDEVTDLATDLRADTVPWPEAGGRVHRGFAMSLRSVLPGVMAWLENECSARASLLICGHSLGAALATLTASVLREFSLVTLGSPRVGDEEFASTLRGADVTRVVDCCDIVTQLPPETPWYTHVGSKMYVDRNGAIAVGPLPQDVLEDQARARSEYILEHAWKAGSVAVRDLADHAPVNYIRAFF